MPKKQARATVTPLYPRSLTVGTTPPSPPIAAPLRDAQEELEVAEGSVALARARLRDTTSAAYAGHPTTAIAQARARAERAAGQVRRRQSQVLDAEGRVELRTLEAHEPPSSADLIVIERAERRLGQARDRLLHAQEVGARAEAELAALEELSATDLEPTAVIAARLELAAAERAKDRAEAAVAEARRAAQGASPMVPEFASLDAFVEDFILPNWRHRMADLRWCATWWRHAEAVGRLEALWEAFEVLRLQPAPAMSLWWRDHLDPQMRALTAGTGTFGRCSATRHDTVHQQDDLWPCQPAPSGQFHTDPDSPRQPSRVTNAQKEA